MQRIRGALPLRLQGNKALSILEASLVRLYTVILRFLANAVRLFAKAAPLHALNAVLTPGDVENLIAECEKQEASLESDASNCDRLHQMGFQTAHTEQLHALRKALCAPVVRIDAGVEALLDRSNRAETCAILQWASHTPYASNHIAAKEGRTAGSAEWILKHPTYREWRASSASMLLWLHGIRKCLALRRAPPPPKTHPTRSVQYSLKLACPIAGAGKTKVVSRVIDDIQEALASQRNDEAFAYYYFNRNDTSRQNASAALCSLVRQLSVTLDGQAMQQSLVELYKSKHQRGLAEACLHEAEAKQLLHQFVDSYPQTTIVLDALDECDMKTRTSFIILLQDVARSGAKPIKIFVSSRLDQDIKQRLKREPNLAIRAVDYQDDIVRFVEAEMAGEPHWSEKVPDYLRQEIAQTLRDQSRGM
jgi:hypothetical protein